jgi:hypothetical protein
VLLSVRAAPRAVKAIANLLALAAAQVQDYAALLIP